MRGKFGRVHALYGGDAVGEVADVYGNELVLKDVCAFVEVLDEEIFACVLGGFVVIHAALVFGAADYVERFKTRRPHVFEVYVFEVAVGADDETAGHLVAGMHFGVGRYLAEDGVAGYEN